MNMTLAEIGAEVRKRITQGARPREAAQAVAEAVVGKETGRLRQLYETGALTEFCRLAEWKTVYSPGADDQRRGDTQLSPAVRTRYDAFHDDPLSCEVPIGNTGTRKTIGDLTDADLLLMEAYAKSMVRGWTQVADMVHRVRRKLKKGETVREAWNRLTEEDKRWLVSRRRPEIED